MTQNRHSLLNFIFILVLYLNTTILFSCDDSNGLVRRLDNLRSGTAIFRFDSSHWETDGRAILNLSPAEAIRFYRNDLEMIDQELAGQP